MPLQQLPFGPFATGVLDTANPSQGLTGVLKTALGVVYTGGGKLSTRDGSRVVLTLKDDQGSPADVTSVIALAPFSDSALAVAHSTVTSKVYLYRLSSTMDDWYDNTGALQGTTSPHPVGVLWTSVTTAPDVTIAEGLGIAYIAHSEPVVGSTLTYATRMFTPPGTLADLTSDLDVSGGAESLYFAGVISFQQHLWGWGFGSGTTASTGYRPELARFSRAIFDTTGGLFAPSDSLTLGNRVRSEREAIVGAGLAGQSLYLGAPFMLTRITGYGRETWFKEPVDQSHGFVGPKCMVTVGDVLYYWSSRGPMRVGPSGTPEPLWDRVSQAVSSAINVASIVAGYNEATDEVVWVYDAGSGVRTRLAYDVRRNAFLGPTDDMGLGVHCLGRVAPVYTSTAAVSYAPAGPPTSASTTLVGTTSGTANWTAGDLTAPSQVEYRVQGTTPWTVATSSLTAGVQSYTFSGLTSGVAYEWRVAHSKGGTLSSYLGPSAATQFTTTSQLLPPTDLAGDGSGVSTIELTWTNSGEAGVSTEVWAAKNGGSLTLRATQGVGVSSYSLATGQFSWGSGDSWDINVRHVKSGVTASDFSSPITVALP